MKSGFEDEDLLASIKLRFQVESKSCQTYPDVRDQICQTYGPRKTSYYANVDPKTPGAWKNNTENSLKKEDTYETQQS